VIRTFGYIAGIDYLCSGESGGGAFRQDYLFVEFAYVNEMLNVGIHAVITIIIITFVTQ
jgi:hypothetical protein